VTIPREALRQAVATTAPTLPAAEAMRVQVAPSPAPTPIKVPRTVATVAPAPTPAPTPTAVPVKREATTAPAPSSVLFARRAVSLGAMEEPMQYYDYNLGALTIPRELFRRTAVAAPLTTLAPRQTAPTQSYVGGYPVVREEEKADWTTYAMIGAAVLVVGGGVWYAKKKRMF
jgi:hypothetical protein